MSTCMTGTPSYVLELCATGRKSRDSGRRLGERCCLNTPVLPLGAKGKSDCMEAEHQVKDKTSAAELLTRQSQLETVKT